MSNIFTPANILVLLVATLFCNSDASTKNIKSKLKYYRDVKEGIPWKSADLSIDQSSHEDTIAKDRSGRSDFHILPRTFSQVMGIYSAIPALITYIFGYSQATAENDKVWSFNGTGTAFIKPENRSMLNNYTVSFWFRTTQPSVSLATITGKDWAADLQLSQGKLRLMLPPNHIITHTSSTGMVNDGKWHKAFLSLNSSHVVLISDNEEEQTKVSIPELNNFNFNTQINTAISFALLTYNLISFVGCIKELRISDTLYKPEPSDSVLIDGVGTECNFKDCTSNPCENQGTCTDIDGKPHFICPIGVDGETCHSSSNVTAFNFNKNTKYLPRVELPYTSHVASLQPFVLSMLVKTNVSQGNVFFISDGLEQESSLYIQAVISQRGNLIVKFKLNACYSGEEVMEQVSLDKFVSDGKQHKISIQFASNYLLVSVDEFDTIRYTPNNCFSNFSPIMKIGGKPMDLVEEINSNSNYTHVNTANTTQVNVMYDPHGKFNGVIKDIRVRWYNTLGFSLAQQGFSFAVCGFEGCNLLEKEIFESVLEYSNDTETSDVLHELKPRPDDLWEIFKTATG